MSGQAMASGWHGCTILSTAEQGWEALSTFVGDGLGDHEKAVIAGLRVDQADVLLRRLHEDGVDPGPPTRSGQVLVMPAEASRELLELPAAHLAGMLTDQIQQALDEGFNGLRLGGIYPGSGVGPFERTLGLLVRSHPLTVFCAYEKSGLAAGQVDRVRELHDREVQDSAVYDDGALRITRPYPGWLRLAGRWSPQNHVEALAVVAAAAAAGHRNVDAASLRYVDPAGLHALLTGISGGLRLRRPNDLVRRLAGLIAARHAAGEPGDRAE